MTAWTIAWTTTWTWTHSFTNKSSQSRSSRLRTPTHPKHPRPPTRPAFLTSPSRVVPTSHPSSAATRGKNVASPHSPPTDILASTPCLPRQICAVLSIFCRLCSRDTLAASAGSSRSVTGGKRLSQKAARRAYRPRLAAVSATGCTVPMHPRSSRLSACRIVTKIPARGTSSGRSTICLFAVPARWACSSARQYSARSSLSVSRASRSIACQGPADKRPSFTAGVRRPLLISSHLLSMK